jgi:hypothetical protein
MGQQLGASGFGQGLQGHMEGHRLRGQGHASGQGPVPNHGKKTSIISSHALHTFADGLGAQSHPFLVAVRRHANRALNAAGPIEAAGTAISLNLDINCTEVGQFIHWTDQQELPLFIARDGIMELLKPKSRFENAQGNYVH